MTLTEQIEYIKELNQLAKDRGITIPLDISIETKATWRRVGGGEFWWNEGGNKNDLIEGDGETYSSESSRIVDEDENFILLELRDYQFSGEYYLFSKTNEVSEEEYDAYYDEQEEDEE